MKSGLALPTNIDVFAEKARNISIEKILGFYWDSNQRPSEYQSDVFAIPLETCLVD